MGTVRANNALTVVQGKVGELSFAHYQDGRIIVRKTPGTKTRFTAGQFEQQSRFARAVLFLKAIKGNPVAYAAYKNQALIRRKRACDLAIADFLSQPIIQDVDLTSYTGAASEPIRIEAFDSFAVKEVSVVLTSADGTVSPTCWASRF